jgi:uncharacterized protein YfiM (DUF2279 family)
MKAFVVTIIILLTICSAQSTQSDSLNTKYHTIGFNKIQHAAVSCLLTLSSQYVMVNKSGIDENKALSYSVGTSVAIGLTKELNDCQTKGNSFNWGDLIANGIGIAIAVLIITN